MKKVLAFGLVSVLPVMALAQSTTYITNWITQIQNIINSLVPVLVGLAVLFFIWNIFKYIKSDDPKTKGDAAKGMMWGIVFLAVIVSVWGLVALLQKIFDVDTRGVSNVGNLVPRN
jgi:mannose/fructose/N-acetylgalactosamine-specific phosphotransferase system component IID